jgi:rubrerythrin
MTFAEQIRELGVAQMASVEATVRERPIGHAVETAADAYVVGTENDIRQFRRRMAAAQATAMCGAASTPDFLEAAAFYRDALEQIDRTGKCQACGFTLIGGDIECSRCGRIND